MTESNLRLSGEDLTFWWMDTPMQPTTMAMLMILDRAPTPHRLEHAFQRALAAVPRLTERVVEAPLGITLPHWERDPTFHLDYHVRRHVLSGAADHDELLHEIAPVYEAPFDRSRPLWEARVYDHVGEEGRSALFFKLHHAVADGVGANAIFAALTDCQREEWEDEPHPEGCEKGCWPATPSLGWQVLDAIRDRVALDVGRATAVAGTVVDTLRHPSQLGRALQALRSAAESVRFDSHSPLKANAGRARCLSGTALPFAEVRALKKDLGGSMIDVILTIMARAIGKWFAAQHIANVDELMTLVPVNLRKPEDWAEKAAVGNVATGILVPLPIRIKDPLATFHEVRTRMEAKKADPLSTASPALAEVLSVLPRSLFSWMAEASFGAIDFIVTNVPGILVPRYLAGAEIEAAYPFAPVAMRSPVSVALYGYRDRLFIGLDSDRAMMPDVEPFKRMIESSFSELKAAARKKAQPSRRKRAS